MKYLPENMKNQTKNAPKMTFYAIILLILTQLGFDGWSL